jgi:hypothetical protein
MEPAVIAAIVAGIVSLLVNYGKMLWESREKKQEQEQQRRLAARDQLDTYRAPLLAAVDDLGSRINNIRNDGFLTYLHLEGREQTARLGTLFRFAQFFGWAEILYGYADRLRFEKDENTKLVADLLNKIGKTLADDGFDRLDDDFFETTQLMLWREEQRAIGEMMRVSDEHPRCVSFDSFTQEYEKRYSRWFTTFSAQLDPDRTPYSQRLEKLQELLAKLLEELDVDNLLVKVDPKAGVLEPRWARADLIHPPKGTRSARPSGTA